MEAQKRSAGQMVNLLVTDPTRLEKLKTDPVPVLKETAATAEAITPAYMGDAWLYRAALGVLSLLALATAIGSLILSLAARPIPEVLVALGSAAVGGLVGLFAPYPRAR